MAKVLFGDGSAFETVEPRAMVNVQTGESTDRNISNLAFIAVLLLLILLAFGLRLYALERQSMWSDEGLSYYRALQSPSELLNGLIVIDAVETRDTNPPLYFLLLHFWRNLAGDSITSLRYSGVLAGTLAVPLMFILGSILYGRWVGLASALLMTISPFHIWQSQVLRNYSLLLTFNLASVFGLFRYVLSTPGKTRWRWLALWFAAGLLGIYTHYFGFLVFAFGVFVLMFFGLWCWGIRRLVRQQWFWLFLVLGAVILLPAAAIGFERFQAGQQIDFYQVELSQVLVHAASAFAVGVEPHLQHVWWRILPALLLALWGLMSGWRARHGATALLLGYQLVPLGLLLLLSTINPLYNGVRHLLIGLPPFLVLVAVGAAGKPDLNGQLLQNKTVWPFVRGLQLLLFIVVIVVQLDWLHTQFTDNDLLRDDIRGAAEYLNKNAAADDLIILHDTIIGPTFDYYYDGAAPWRAIPSLGEQDVVSAEAALAEAGTLANRIWFLTQPTPRTGFPRKTLWEWADANWPRFFNREFPSMWLRVQLNGYIPEPVRDKLPQDAAKAENSFGGALQLHGVELPSQVRAGEPWWAIFYWSRLGPDTKDYGLSIRLLDEEGQLWAQEDNPLWQENLPDDLAPNAIIRNDQEIELESGIPPGDYEVWLRVFDGEMRPLPANGDQVDVLVGDIELLAGTDFAGLPPFSKQKLQLGELDFLGFNLPSDGIRPGHVIPIDLFWHVRQAPAEDSKLRIQLVDQYGKVTGETETTVTRSDYPPSIWQVGELLQSKIQMAMPANAADTPYWVRVILFAPLSGETIATVTLNEKLSVDPWPFVDEVPLGLELLNADFGELAEITLHGLDLPSATINPGGLLNFTLYWQANKEIIEGYHVFVHLISSDGMIVDQWDGAPVQGFRPTLGWREGEVIKDDYSIPVSSELPPGKVQLWTGLYQPQTQERLPAMVDGQPIPDKRVYLGEITVEQAE